MYGFMVGVMRKKKSSDGMKGREERVYNHVEGWQFDHSRAVDQLIRRWDDSVIWSDRVEEAETME